MRPSGPLLGRVLTPAPERLASTRIGLKLMVYLNLALSSGMKTGAYTY